MNATGLSMEDDKEKLDAWRSITVSIGLIVLSRALKVGNSR